MSDHKINRKQKSRNKLVFLYELGLTDMNLVNFKK